MNIKAFLENGVIHVTLVGRMDMANAILAERAFLKYSQSGNNFVLDFTDVEYIASAGIRALLNLYRIVSEGGGSVVIEHPQAQVLEVLEETDFAELFEIH